MKYQAYGSWEEIHEFEEVVRRGNTSLTAQIRFQSHVVEGQAGQHLREEQRQYDSLAYYRKWEIFKYNKEGVLLDTIPLKFWYREDEKKAVVIFKNNAYEITQKLAPNLIIHEITGQNQDIFRLPNEQTA